MTPQVQPQKTGMKRPQKATYRKPEIHCFLIAMEAGIAAGSASISVPDTPEITDWEETKVWDDEIIKMPEY